MFNLPTAHLRNKERRAKPPGGRIKRTQYAKVIFSGNSLRNRFPRINLSMRPKQLVLNEERSAYSPFADQKLVSPLSFCCAGQSNRFAAEAQKRLFKQSAQQIRHARNTIELRHFSHHTGSKILP